MHCMNTLNPCNFRPDTLMFYSGGKKMGKSRDTKKDVKKKPSKTIKEKRKEKQEKKKGLGINIDT